MERNNGRKRLSCEGESVTNDRSMRSRKRLIMEYECEIDEFEDEDNMVILPNPEDSGDSDTDDETQIGNSSHDSDDLDGHEVQSISYRKVFENYSQTQRLLEPDHAYEWKEGEKLCVGNINDELLLSNNVKSQIRNSSLTELFELFFSKNLKKYVVGAPCERGFDLSMNDFEVFIGILLLSLSIQYSNKSKRLLVYRW